MELVNSLDDLLQYSAWFGYGTATEINTGSGFGAEKNNPFIKKLMEHYLALDDNSKFIVCTQQESSVFKNEFPEFYADKSKKKDQIVGDNIIILWNIWQYTNHHFTSTWQSPLQKAFNKTKIIKPLYFWLKNKLTSE